MSAQEVARPAPLSSARSLDDRLYLEAEWKNYTLEEREEAEQKRREAVRKNVEKEAEKKKKEAERMTLMVVWGPSQSGRTTLVNKMGGGDEVSPGNDDGESTTQRCHPSRTKLGALLDTPGYDDSQLRFAEHEVAEMTATSVASSNAKFVRFVVFESMANDTMKLRQSLASLSHAFAGIPVKSILVLASKMDMCQDPTHRAKRMALIRKAMEEKGLTQLVEWQNQGLDAAGEAAQLAKLQGALKHTAALDISKLTHPETQLMKRAEELCATAPAQHNEVMVNVAGKQVPRPATYRLPVEHFMAQAKMDMRQTERFGNASASHQGAVHHEKAGGSGGILVGFVKLLCGTV